MAGCLLGECLECRIGINDEKWADDSDGADVVAEHGRALAWVKLDQGNSLRLSSPAQLDLAGGTGILDPVRHAVGGDQPAPPVTFDGA